MQSVSFSRRKMNQKRDFLVAKFFKNLHVEKILFQNLTRCIFYFKIRRAVKFLNQNLKGYIF